MQNSFISSSVLKYPGGLGAGPQPSAKETP